VGQKQLTVYKKLKRDRCPKMAVKMSITAYFPSSYVGNPKPKIDKKD
jgi:hypothetical protein